MIDFGVSDLPAGGGTLGTAVRVQGLARDRTGHWSVATASANICTFLYVLCSSLYRQSQNDNPSLEEFPAPVGSNSG